MAGLPTKLQDFSGDKTKHTVDSGLRWYLEIYPWDTEFPEKIVWSLGLMSLREPEVVSEGVRYINITRAKNNINGQCTVGIVGPVNPLLTPGTWVVVTSVESRSSEKTANEKAEDTYPLKSQKVSEFYKNIAPVAQILPRFIGQISSIDVTYSKTDSGTLATVTALTIREWSSLLDIPVRYDTYSIVKSLSQEAIDSGALVQASGVSPQKYHEIMSKIFNPFELAHVILTLVGAINSNDSISKVTEICGNTGLPNVSVKMPHVPPSLLARLGMNTVDSHNPFSTGFLTVITGTLAHPNSKFTHKWNGVFDNIRDLSKMYDMNPPGRPVASNMVSLLTNGDSVWALLTKYCDPSLNEFVTDIIYEERTDVLNPSIVARPVLFVRDKPFALKTLSGSLTHPWTKYDNLPRIKIQSAYITSFTIGNTIINSPNFIRPNFTSELIDTNTIKPAAEVYGTIRLEPEINRFGGNEFFIDTNFVSQEWTGQGSNKVKGATNTTPPAVNSASSNPLSAISDFVDRSKGVLGWFKDIARVAQIWHSYDYRMATGVLKIKDHNVPITVGFNVEFKIGKRLLVGHVESVGIEYEQQSGGLKTTNTVLRLSKIVQVNTSVKGFSISGDTLELLTPSEIGSLFIPLPAKEKETDSNLITDNLRNVMS